MIKFTKSTTLLSIHYIQRKKIIEIKTPKDDGSYERSFFKAINLHTHIQFYSK